MAKKLSGVKVLLIDDDEDTVALYSFALEELGADVRSALSGADALRSVEGWCPAVVVSDLGIPGTDVGVLLRDLRKAHPSASMPAIAVTGRSTIEDRDAALALGFQEHAVKPLVPDDLAALIERRAATS